MDRFANEWQRLCSSSLIHNAKWIFLGQGMSYIFQSVYFILLGRLLGSTEYGIYMGVVALASILSQYSSFGFQWVFLQYVSPDHSQFSRYWGNILITTISLGVLFTIFLVIAGPHIALFRMRQHLTASYKNISRLFPTGFPDCCLI